VYRESTRPGHFVRALDPAELPPQKRLHLRHMRRGMGVALSWVPVARVGNQRRRKERRKMLSTILIVVLVLMVLGAFPAWPYSRGWGYFPSGLLGIVLLVFLILALTGRV
jgi:hypothetical protein